MIKVEEGSVQLEGTGAVLLAEAIILVRAIEKNIEPDFVKIFLSYSSIKDEIKDEQWLKDFKYWY